MGFSYKENFFSLVAMSVMLKLIAIMPFLDDKDFQPALLHSVRTANGRTDNVTPLPSVSGRWCSMLLMVDSRKSR
jgi:hypothetical protein